MGSGSGPVGQEEGPDRDIEQLARLAELRREGLLTDEEFNAKKLQILGVPQRAAKAPRTKKQKRLLVLAVFVVVLAGGGTALGLKLRHDAVQRDKAVAAAKREEAAQARREAAARRAAAKKRAQEAADRLERVSRRFIVKDLKKSVQKDFEGRVAQGQLEGPILTTSCDPVGGGYRDLDVRTGKFECLVATEDLGNGRLRGYPVTATVNFSKGSYTWQLSD